MAAAKEYAKALFELAEEVGSTEKTLEELRLVNSVIKSEPSYIKLLETPSLPMEKKLELIDEAFASLCEYTINTLKLLCEGRLISVIPELFSCFEALYDDSRGITRVVAETAVPMSEAQIFSLKQRLEGTLGGQVIISNRVDTALLGGVRLRYTGIQIDGSIKSRLDKLAASIKNVIL